MKMQYIVEYASTIVAMHGSCSYTKQTRMIYSSYRAAKLIYSVGSWGSNKIFVHPVYGSVRLHEGGYLYSDKGYVV